MSKIKPISVIYLIFGILFFVFLETDIFEGLSDITKILIYVGFNVLILLSGLRQLDLKKFGMQFMEIIKDNTIDPEEKLKQLFSLAIPILSEIGNVFELIYEKQDEVLKEKVKEEAKELIEKATEELTE